MSDDLLNEQQAASENPQQPFRRGPGRPPKNAEPEAVIGAAVSETITYIPGDGDPATVKWGGIVFEANEAAADQRPYRRSAQEGMHQAGTP